MRLSSHDHACLVAEERMDAALREAEQWRLARSGHRRADSPSRLAQVWLAVMRRLGPVRLTARRSLKATHGRQ